MVSSYQSRQEFQSVKKTLCISIYTVSQGPNLYILFCLFLINVMFTTAVVDEYPNFTQMLVLSHVIQSALQETAISSQKWTLVSASVPLNF